MNKCKYCNSANLILEPRVQGQDIMTADQVALKCDDCGKWIKWCPKDQRKYYIQATKQSKEKTEAGKSEELNARLVEEMELSAKRRQIIEELTIENKEQDKKIDKLEKQVEEKEKEIKRFMSMKNRDQLVSENEALKDTIAVVLAQKRNISKSYEQLKQLQNQKAIEELNKLKMLYSKQIEICGGKATHEEIIVAGAYNKCIDDIKTIIDDKIKKLKGARNGK